MHSAKQIAQSAWRRLRSIPAPVIVFAAWLVAIAYAYPGYMNWDSGDQIWMARTGVIEDWHAPVMAKYWRVVELVIHGPFGMLVLQLSLFVWGIYALVRVRFDPHPAAVATAALVLFPPILTPMAVVWKDAQMAGWLAAGVALALRPSRRARIAGLVMLALASGVRDNGVAALPPLCVLIAASWGARRKRTVITIAMAMVIGLGGVAAVANHVFADRRTYPWYKANAIHDIAGAICNEDPMTDAEVRDELDGIQLLVTSDLQANLCKQYNPRYWFPLTFGGNDIFVQMPDKAERLARRGAWFRILRDHTWAWVEHRVAVMTELLGFTAIGAEEPVCQSFAANPAQLARINHDASLSWFQQAAGAVFLWLAKTHLFRPWLYLLAGLVLSGYAYRKRDGLLGAILASGMCYEASYFLGAAGPAYRYSHWMIACTCVAGMTVFVSHLQQRRARVHPSEPAPASDAHD